MRTEENFVLLLLVFSLRKSYSSMSVCIYSLGALVVTRFVFASDFSLSSCIQEIMIVGQLYALC